MNVFAVVCSSGKRIHVDECMERKDKSYTKGSFSCIDCSNPVYPRRGDKRAWHFSHYSSKQNQACPHRNGGETLEHYKSKHWIAKHIACIQFNMGWCTVCFRNRKLERPSGSYILSAEVEKRIPGTNRIADVLLVERSVTTGYTKTVAAVEVFHTHEVDEQKRADCMNRGIRILEVTTDSVLRAMELHCDKCETSVVKLSVRCPVKEACNQCVMQSAFIDDLNRQLYHWGSYNEKYRCFYNKTHWQPKHSTPQTKGAENRTLQTKGSDNNEATSRTDDVKICAPEQNKPFKRKACDNSATNADTKRLALEEARNRVLAFKELSLQRSVLLREMQARDISEGKGGWNNERYWKNFHQVTKLVFGE